MKKKVLTICFLLGSLSTSLFAGFECRVSANEDLNKGFCREYSEGNELCYPDGKGPKCYKSEFTLIPE